MVAMQLASSQLTPRVLHHFIGDRANYVVLGVFISTFTYALLVLRTVRSAAEDGAGYVQAIDEDSLIARGEEMRLTIRLEQGVGDFVVPGAPLASMAPPAVATPELVEGV